MAHALKKFLEGYDAAIQLLKRAGEDGFIVEYVCLATSIIDASLRIALVLRHQLDSKSSEIPTALLYQGADDKIISERKIYEKARDANVLPQGMFEELERLYAERNRVVHRYIISEITTARVFELAVRYESLLPRIFEITSGLEEEQVRTGIGMTRSSGGPPESEENLWDEISRNTVGKHGSWMLWHTLSKKNS